ncbi:MAG: cell division protein ZapA [Pigmentiphaga sp.]
MERIDVSIMGRDYAMVCEPEGKEALLNAANMVDQIMQRIRASGKVAGNEKIAVMAALQLASELLNARSPDGPLSELALGDYKQKLSQMTKQIDDVLAAQETLF